MRVQHVVFVEKVFGSKLTANKAQALYFNSKSKDNVLLIDGHHRLVRKLFEVAEIESLEKIETGTPLKVATKTIRDDWTEILTRELNSPDGVHSGEWYERFIELRQPKIVNDSDWMIIGVHGYTYIVNRKHYTQLLNEQQELRKRGKYVSIELLFGITTSEQKYLQHIEELHRDRLRTAENVYLTDDRLIGLRKADSWSDVRRVLGKSKFTVQQMSSIGCSYTEPIIWREYDLERGKMTITICDDDSERTITRELRHEDLEYLKELANHPNLLNYYSDRDEILVDPVFEYY